MPALTSATSADLAQTQIFPAPATSTPPSQSAPLDTSASISQRPGSRRRSRRLSPALEKFFSLALPVFGLLAILALILWGIGTVFTTLRAHSRRVEAGQLTQQAADALRQGNYTAAAQTYAEAADKAPPDSKEASQARIGQSQAYTAEGIKASQGNDLLGAQNAYQKAIEANAANAAALDNLGNLYWQQGQRDSALDSWEKAVQADPTSASGKEAQQNAVQHYMDMAQAAVGLGNVTQARIYWQKVT